MFNSICTTQLGFWVAGDCSNFLIEVMVVQQAVKDSVSLHVSKTLYVYSEAQARLAHPKSHRKTMAPYSTKPYPWAL